MQRRVQAPLISGKRARARDKNMGLRQLINVLAIHLGRNKRVQNRISNKESQDFRAEGSECFEYDEENTLDEPLAARNKKNAMDLPIVG
jgi:hypothetical protein